MQDTKNNNVKESSFAEQLQQAKSQDLIEKEEADRLFTQLKKDVETNWKECFEKCIQDGYIEVKNNIMRKVEGGKILKHKDKNRVYVYYNFKETINVPKEFYEKMNETIIRISKLSKKDEYEIKKQIPQIAAPGYSSYGYKMCNPTASGFIFVGLNEVCVQFAEELEKRLSRDGIKLEGIVSRYNNIVVSDAYCEKVADYHPVLKKIRGKKLFCFLNGDFWVLKFSMEF